MGNVKLSSNDKKEISSQHCQQQLKGNKIIEQSMKQFVHRFRREIDGSGFLRMEYTFREMEAMLET